MRAIRTATFVLAVAGILLWQPLSTNSAAELLASLTALSQSQPTVRLVWLSQTAPSNNCQPSGLLMHGNLRFRTECTFAFEYSPTGASVECTTSIPVGWSECESILEAKFVLRSNTQDQGPSPIVIDVIYDVVDVSYEPAGIRSARTDVKIIPDSGTGTVLWLSSDPSRSIAVRLNTETVYRLRILLNTAIFVPKSAKGRVTVRLNVLGAPCNLPLPPGSAVPFGGEKKCSTTVLASCSRRQIAPGITGCLLDATSTDKRGVGFELWCAEFPECSPCFGFYRTDGPAGARSLVGKCWFGPAYNRPAIFAVLDPATRLPECFVSTTWINYQVRRDEQDPGLPNEPTGQWHAPDGKLDIWWYRHSVASGKTDISVLKDFIEVFHQDPATGVNFNDLPPAVATPIVTVGEMSVIPSCDINGDGLCNASDQTFSAAALGSCRGGSGYNVLADVNGDGCVTPSEQPQVVSALSGLSVRLDAPEYHHGETMGVTALLTSLVPAATVDAYIVLRLPSGQFLSLQLGGSLVAGLVPIARNFVPFHYEAPVLQYSFTGADSVGVYTWYAALVQPGTLSLVAPLDQKTFTVR